MFSTRFNSIAHIIIIIINNNISSILEKTVNKARLTKATNSATITRMFKNTTKQPTSNESKQTKYKQINA